MKYKCIYFLFILILMVSCLKTRSSIKEAEEKKVFKEQLSKLQVNTADQQEKFNEIYDLFRKLNGRLELIERQLEEEKNNKIQESNFLNEKLNSFQEQIDALKEEIRKIYNIQKSNDVLNNKDKNFPKGNYATAEEAFKQKNWKKAIIGYEKYRELNPKGKRYARSTYMIGVCFQELNMKQEAKAFFQEVIVSFPKSSYAKKASYRLKKIK